MCKTLATECVVAPAHTRSVSQRCSCTRTQGPQHQCCSCRPQQLARNREPVASAHGSLFPGAGACLCRYEGGDKVSQVMREVDQVKGVMSDNINQAMSNLESTEALNEKTQEMKAQSNMFNKQAKTAKNQMWWKNMKLNIIIAAVVIIIVASMVMNFWPSR